MPIDLAALDPASPLAGRIRAAMARDTAARAPNLTTGGHSEVGRSWDLEVGIAASGPDAAAT